MLEILIEQFIYRDCTDFHRYMPLVSEKKIVCGIRIRGVNMLNCLEPGFSGAALIRVFRFPQD